MSDRGLFPNKESEKNLYFNTAGAHLIDNAERLKVSDENKSLLNEELRVWNEIFPLSQDPNMRTKLIVANKDTAKENLMNTFRSIYGDLPQSVLTTEDRAILNLEERSTTKTPVPIPDTFPIGKINFSNRLEHSISFTNEDGKHGKPKGVRGCQIWCKEGEPALDEKQLLFLGTDTASPFLKKYSIADAGKTIHYWLRWENTRGETGPWSAVVSATVLR